MNAIRLSMITILLSLTGCISTGVKVDTTVEYNGGGTLEYTFVNSVGDNKLTEKNIIDGIIKTFNNKSKYKARESYRGKHGSNITRGFDYSHKIIDSKDYIQIQNIYVVGKSYDSRQTALFEVDIEDKGGNYNVLITCPNKFTDKAKLRKNGDQRVLIATKNFTHLCTLKDISIARTQYITGEINSEYSKGDVFSNFYRILNRKAPETISNEKQKFLIKAEGFSSLVDISVFPYRGGSKTNYRFSYPYNLLSDGTTNYSENDIMSLKNKISNIVND